MRYTSEQLTALINLRARGELSVRFGDRSVTYRSDAELAAAIAAAQRHVAEDQGIAKTRVMGQHGRGY